MSSHANPKNQLEGERKKLTAIVINYNQANYLRQSLEAVAAQSRQANEFIVVDDGSQDESPQIIADFAAQHANVTPLINEKNRGFMSVFKEAIQVASGDYMLISSSDDFVSPGFFEKAMAMLETNPSAGLCCGPLSLMRPSLGWVNDVHIDWSDHSTFLSPHGLIDSLQGRSIPGHASIVKRTAYDDSGGFLENLQWHCDWFCYLVVGFRNGICFIPERLAVMRVMSDTLSAPRNRPPEKQLEVCRRILELLNSDEYCDVHDAFLQSRALDSLGVEMQTLLFGDEYPCGFSRDRVQVDTLEELACNANDAFVRFMAAHAICRLQGRDFPVWSPWFQAMNRYRSRRALTRLGSTRALRDWVHYRVGKVADRMLRS